MKVIDFLILLRDRCYLQTKEGRRAGLASNSELRRWCQNKAVLVNGEAVAWDEQLDFLVFSVVLFPKRRISLL